MDVKLDVIFSNLYWGPLERTKHEGNGPIDPRRQWL